MKVAVLGAGTVGTVLAHGLLQAGHEVVLGVRDPGRPRRVRAPLAALPEAVAGASAVVNALPGSDCLEVLQQVGPALDGTVLVDVANAVTPRFELLHPNGSLGSLLQQRFPAVRVVKTLNTVPAAVMAGPDLLPAASSVFLSGDDAAAKQLVGGLLTDLGWAPEQQVDLGGIETSRATEHYLYLSIALMQVTGSTTYNVAVVR